MEKIGVNIWWCGNEIIKKTVDRARLDLIFKAQGAHPLPEGTKWITMGKGSSRYGCRLNGISKDLYLWSGGQHGNNDIIDFIMKED